MPNSLPRREHRTPAQREQILRAWRASALPDQAFAAQAGVGVQVSVLTFDTPGVFLAEKGSVNGIVIFSLGTITLATFSVAIQPVIRMAQKGVS